MLADILVIDDEKDIRELICDILNDEDYHARSAASSQEAFKQLHDKIPTAIILDIWLQGSELDGLGVLEILIAKFPYIPIVMISGHGTIETAVKAIKMGAYDYIEKPFTEDKLLIVIKRACEVAKLYKENFELRSKFPEEKEIIGESKTIIQLKSLINRIAITNSRILVTGPSGSGKKLIAKYIHEKSKRKDENFFILDVAGIDENKLEIELFGDNFIKNFNDSPRKVGILELANNGSLYIDEIGELPINIQNKLLNFLQDQTLIRANGEVLKLDVRIIASTSKNLLEEIEINKFKKDLYYRLNVMSIDVPSLSKRKEDISLLCNYFIKNICLSESLKSKKLSEEVITFLQSYQWPGNIRELKNIIERLLIISNADNLDEINSSILPPEIMNQQEFLSNDFDKEIISLPLKQAREIFEKKYLKTQINRFNNNISKMAKFIEMERSALHRKLKSLDIITNSEEE